MSTPIPVIAIVGPTAAGKTKVALHLLQVLAQKHPSDWSFCVLSADSRQVYQGLEITTGADIPATSQSTQHPNLTYPYFCQTLPSGHVVEWHGASIIAPTKAWSVAHFRHLAWQVVARAATLQQIVIMTGGTGLYHQALFDQSLDAISVKPNYTLRAQAVAKTVEELQHWLQSVAPVDFATLNDSDRHNPRRLIRHLERALATIPTTSTTTTSLTAPPLQLHTYGLWPASLPDLADAIQLRVKNRIQQGAIQEVSSLDLSALDPQAKSTLGVKEIQGFLESTYDLSTLEQLWALHEKQYAKRQLTWWKKRPQITWINPLDSDQLNGLIHQISTVTAG